MASEEREELIRVGERMEPETVDVILENRKLSAENADLRQQIADLERLASDYAGVITVRDRELADLRQQLAEAQATIERNESRYAGIDMVYESCKEKDVQLAAQSAEIERLRKAVKDSLTTIGELGASLDDQCVKNATLRERLEAAERFRFTSSDGGSSIEITKVPLGWFVYISHYGQYGPKGGRLGYFKDFDAAHASLVKAGWLPPASTNNEPPKGQ